MPRPPRLIGLLLATACSLTAASSSAAEPAPRPNIVLVLTDDQGWGDLSIHGNTNLSTPRIDSLAKSGTLFERFFVCPVCSPTRAEILTGRYHPRGGVWSTSSGGERLNLDERTIADLFKGAGYATGAFGKWHNGSQYPYHPNARGFDEYYGFTSGHWGDYFDPPLEHNGRPVRGKGFVADDLTDRAIAFIEEHRKGPFFCYVPYNTPHSPMQVPDSYFDKLAKREIKLRGRNPQSEDLTFTRAALAMCENIDANVGRILDRLDQLQLADRTIVVYLCDNGPNSTRWNDGMKGTKGSTDEGGVRSPLLIRWQGNIPAGLRVQWIAGAIDLLPTLADLAGVKVETDPAKQKKLDGVSLRPLLAEKPPADWPDRLLFSHWNGKVSARSDRFRLDNDGKLFDMVADPGQERDIAGQDRATADRLTKGVAQWKTDVLAGLKREIHPFTVGYREFPFTQLPARDGVAHGQVKRSASAPNCSYFKNWASVEDRITWDVDVATAGRYEAEVLYACPQADVGAKIELSLGERRLEFTVSEAHDPPLYGANHDRTDRKSESYVKDFKPLAMGVIELPAGRGTLTLRALKIPGGQAMEVRGIHLTLRK